MTLTPEMRDKKHKRIKELVGEIRTRLNGIEPRLKTIEGLVNALTAEDEPTMTLTPETLWGLCEQEHEEKVAWVKGNRYVNLDCVVHVLNTADANDRFWEKVDPVEDEPKELPLREGIDGNLEDNPAYLTAEDEPENGLYRTMTPLEHQWMDYKKVLFELVVFQEDYEERTKDKLPGNKYYADKLMIIVNHVKQALTAEDEPKCNKPCKNCGCLERVVVCSGCYHYSEQEDE